MPQLKWPDVEKCCGCVRDLKTATAIIAVLGIVTSPAVSWAVVRHSFVIRVSCFVTSSAKRADVVDVNLNNILSFGFGANAGLGPSCLSPKNKTKLVYFRTDETEAGSGSGFVHTVRWMGWAVLVADVIFLGFSIHLLYKIYRPPELKAAYRFMASCIVAIILSFIYGMLFVGACISVGGAFPVFEFFFCIIDVLIFVCWIYFTVVVWTYIRRLENPPPPVTIGYIQSISQIQLPYMWSLLYNFVSAMLGYNISLVTFFSWFSVWTYFLIVVNSYRRKTNSR